MLNYKFTTNNLGSDNWVQLYCEQELIWESEIAWKWIEPVSEELKDKGMTVEIEYVTDDEMSDYSN